METNPLEKALKVLEAKPTLLVSVAKNLGDKREPQIRTTSSS